MSDVSSVHPDSNNSVSTDTEESFLIRQINKSQLFNQSGSSSSGSSTSKKQNRRSFFRESYIDESGQNKSFSVYHDVINETFDESRDIDLSGLSSLDLKLVNNNNVLGELDGNKTCSRSISSKESTIQRQKSLKKNNTTKRLSGSSTISNEFIIPSVSHLPSQNVSSQHLSSYSGSSVLQRANQTTESFDRNQAMKIPTPDRLAPNPPINHNLTATVPTSSRQAVVFQNNYDNRPFSTDSQREAEEERSEIYAAYGNELQQHHHEQSRPPSGIAPSPFTIPSMRMNIGFPSQTSFQSFKHPTKKKSQSSLSSSGKSQISSTMISILEYEESRKRSPGLPNLLINSPNLSNPVRSSHSGSRGGSLSSDQEVKIHNVHSVARRGLGFSIVGVVPSIHSTSKIPGSNALATDDMDIERSKKNSRELELQNLRHNQEKIIKKAKSSNTFDTDNEAALKNNNHSRSSSGSDGYYYDDDKLLNKIRHYRSERPYDPIAQAKKADTKAWLIFFISFLVPPLFFFLGFGILDQFIGHISLHIKRLSLITGVSVLLISLACVGIGFGVGLSSLS